MNNDGLELIKKTVALLEEQKQIVSFEPPSNPMQRLVVSTALETAFEIEKLKSALSYLSPDVDRGLGKFYTAAGLPAKDYWLAVIWSIASLDWASGKGIAKNWSKQSTIRYTDEGFEKDWSDFDPNHPSPIGIGSLFKRAMELGWQKTQQPTSQRASGVYKLLTGNDLRAMPPVRWRLKGALPYEGLAALYGPSASGKSFLALDMCIAIAEGKKWFGIRTTQSTVIYVALEGESGFKNRVAAWELENNRTLPANMFMVMQPFQITNPTDVNELASTIPHGSVVIVDTLNRAAPTSDENSSKEMGEILQSCKWLQGLIGGLVVLVHHTGKDTTKGARGHSSLFAALDGAIEVERSNDKRSWSIAKAKDGQDGKSFLFELKHHTLGQDSDGDDNTSCTIGPASANIFTKTQPKGSKQQEALRKLKNEINAGGIPKTGLVRCPPNTKCIEVEDAITRLAGTLTTTIPKKRKNEARRLVTALIGNGHLESSLDTSNEAWCWISI
jgi:hypothetical protein